ncbi:neuraminidase-like domain-containing protein [Pseudomonas sp. A34-9]|uniref:Tc toxin subunit A-related protein n=1 Tax=Pseudomonas sp. A34-9 TaxID=3034675 RepID=UPI00240E8C25|nr:neuraminidase-like domain-containing protein [Pseudomonas sp. A34-9]
MKNIEIHKQLQESLRDAQVAYYLHLETSENPDTEIRSAEALYDHCLLDALISNDVSTTPVSFAISSLQHHIELAFTRRSSDYSKSEEQRSSWRNVLSHYPTWAAHQQLMYLPSLYLDPALRVDKSENFCQLENDLTQGRIDSATAQKAILGYLTRFEEVANLSILNGYIDGDDVDNGVHYLLAKSRSADRYYWRSLDMSQRPVTLSAEGAEKLKRPDPLAWSQWEKADVPISQNAIQHTIRPVWFNNRLFVFWAESNHQHPHQLAEGSTKGQSNSQVKLIYAWRKIDGTWSLPKTCLERFSKSYLTALTPEKFNKLVSIQAFEKDNQLEIRLTMELDSLGGYIDKNFFLTVTDESTVFQITQAHLNAILELDKHRRIMTKNDKDTAWDIVNEDSSQLLKRTAKKGETSPSHDNSISLDTGFAAEMIRRAENSLDELFNLDSPKSELSAPGSAHTSHQALDFHGAYGQYFTELFLYVPWLLASRLNAEHRYEDAMKWVNYLFDPWGQDNNGQKQFWKSEPLNPVEEPSYALKNPYDPHQIALSHRVHFRKAVFFLYIDILLNRADEAYRRLTTESLNQAKSLYLQARHLLGNRPVINGRKEVWKQITLELLAKDDLTEMKELEQELIKKGGSVPLHLNRQKNPVQLQLPAINHLRIPFHPDLLKRWDQVDSRLYNLRHGLDIAGKRQPVRLFESPLDPRTLLTAHSGGQSDMSSALASTQIPHYRFNVMHGQALSAVDSLIQFGLTLLSLIERQEQSQFQEVQQQQAWALASLAVDLQTQALRGEQQNQKALEVGKAIVQQRFEHYETLLKQDLSAEEANASQLYLRSGVAEQLALASQVGAGALMLAPNTFGLANGGMRWEGALHALSAIAQGASAADQTAASHLDRTAQFTRRREEWTLARDQAALELNQIDAQLKAMEEQQKATELLMRQAQTTLSQAKSNYDFLSTRFTQAQLYQWLGTQLAPLYSQAYDMTLALCKAAEAAWQYEIADFSTVFLPHGTWQNSRRGLGAGEPLKLALMKMQADYLQRNCRELEIRKTVSLRQLKAASDVEWSDVLTNFTDKGKCDFEFKNELFEQDYKKHYLRRIKTISVSFPAVLAPYENVRATLMQLSSEVRLKPEKDSPVLKNQRVNEIIALSTGVDDNGLFTLNFNDERYLPFEFTGAISSWSLCISNHTDQKTFINSLTDVLVHISYTARSSGDQK